MRFAPQPKEVPAAGRAALNPVITQQAQVIASMDDYKLFMIATLALLPLLVFNRPGGARRAEPVTVSE